MEKTILAGLLLPMSLCNIALAADPATPSQAQTAGTPAASDPAPTAAGGTPSAAPASAGTPANPAVGGAKPPAPSAQVLRSAKINRNAAPAKQLPQLTLKTDNIQVVTEGTGDSAQDFVYVEGEYPKMDWGLLLANKMKINRSPKGKFKIKAKLIGKNTALTFTAVGPKGEVVREMVVVSFPGFKPRAKAGSRHFFVPSIGPSLLTYQATSGIQVHKLSEMGITAKFQYSYQLFPPSWDFGLSAYMTALPLTAKYTLTENGAAVDAPASVKMRFYGVNVRIGYVLPFVKEPFRIVIMPGYYYTSTIVTDNRFGFKNLMGPQIFPVVRYALNPRSSVSGYFKYAPIAAGGTIPGAGNREIASGLSYSYRLANGHVVPVSVDWSTLKMNLVGDAQTEDTALQSTSLSFSVGYSW